ncbi:hypothetical protein [Magnetospirillum moscoviense]|uniref:Uncharacterized protein n=1 Tax=Magnetospirillum moscoviense TaxID=1437059 RepID=A0A178MZZ5_9PROT|nr:hypothetical protein [Magnetospirillum moscoviense]MBF0325140.1 hypothetical protein [Alphaproteobacteria bacterium]OAN66485.1 hypothetical protein A6A05_18450 [Magnetospirillum moscoviense]
MRDRLLHRLRSLMARSVANGATPEEELVAARMTAKVMAQLDAMAGIAPLPEAKAEHIRAERDSREYQQLLEKNTTESLFKAAVQELALEHVNRVAPPRKRLPGEQMERVGIVPLLEPYLAMVLAAGNNRLSLDILRRTIEELVYDGQLPPYLDIPASR